jgi:hypothetical protein
MANTITIQIPLWESALLANNAFDWALDFSLESDFNIYEGAQPVWKLTKLEASDIHTIGGDVEHLSMAPLPLLIGEWHLSSKIWHSTLPALEFSLRGQRSWLGHIRNKKLPRLTGVFSLWQEGRIVVDARLPKIKHTIHCYTDSRGGFDSRLPQFLYTFHGLTGDTLTLDATVPGLEFAGHLAQQGFGHFNFSLPAYTTALFVSDNGIDLSSGIRKTIVMNMKTFGVTEYDTSLSLSGLVTFNGQDIAINDNTLVRMGYALDHTEPITASLRTGTINFSVPYYQRPKDVWVTLNSGRVMAITVVDNDGETYQYISENFLPHLKQTRLKVGRGLYSPFYDFILTNLNGDLIEIENIHIATEPVSGRRR